MEENEPLYEVKVIVKGQYVTVLDGMTQRDAEILAENLFDKVGLMVDVGKYWLE